MIGDTDDDLGAQTVSRRDCEHGRLARKCEICELHADIEGYKRHIAVMRERIKALEAVAALLYRYRHETPLGHQPHMIAHETDEALQAAGYPSTEGQGHE